MVFTGENYLLGKDQFLVDVANRIKLWDYEGRKQVATLGDYTLFAVGDEEFGVLGAGRLPHPEAVEKLDQALNQPDLFVFRAGTSVTLDVSGVPADARERVRQALEDRLKEVESTATASGSITLKAIVNGPKSREVSYRGAGDYTVNEYLTKLQFVYQDRILWERQSSNVPGFVSPKRGENISDVLAQAGKKPSYAFYDRVTLPRFLQKPGEEKQAKGRPVSSGQTLGKSRVTTAGIE